MRNYFEPRCSDPKLDLGLIGSNEISLSVKFYRGVLTGVMDKISSHYPTGNRTCAAGFEPVTSVVGLEPATGFEPLWIQSRSLITGLTCYLGCQQPVQRDSNPRRDLNPRPLGSSPDPLGDPTGFKPTSVAGSNPGVHFFIRVCHNSYHFPTVIQNLHFDV